MADLLNYKGYNGTVAYCSETNTLHGEVLGLSGKHKITYEGKTPDELIEDFKTGIDDYLYTCKETGMTPELPFSGKFNVRISPSLHSRAVSAAKRKGLTLNSYVKKALENSLNHEDE